ncbi:hypothetical protein U1Q18_032530, partial [Sarracenia purpurea var. burkii]
EGVALEVEGADLDEGCEVDTGEGVKDGDVGLASEWGIRERRDVRVGEDQGD